MSPEDAIEELREHIDVHTGGSPRTTEALAALQQQQGLIQSCKQDLQTTEAHYRTVKDVVDSWKRVCALFKRMAP